MGLSEREDEPCRVTARRHMWCAALGVLLIVLVPAVRAQQKPCCSVTKIDTHTGLVSAQVAATGQTFEFRLANAALANFLHIRQAVYANFQTKQVSLDGKNVVGTIVSIGAAKGPLVPAAPGKTPSALPAPLPGTSPKITGSGTPQAGRAPPACCAITGINAPAGLVSAKENSTGLGFQFAPDLVPIQNLQVGQSVWANFSMRVVSLNGRIVCCHITSRDGDWFFSHDGAFQASTDPARPAILLFHGLHGSSRAWTKPADDRGVNGWFYDHLHPGSQIRGQSSTPGIGVFKVGPSDRPSDAVNANNWFDFFKSQDFTVATWSQPGETFADAYPSAQEAYRQFLTITQNMNPGAPPPVALIGHSRGGLLIRKLLRDEGTGQSVRWVITLHSPHSGSELALAPERLQGDIQALCSTPVAATLQLWSAAIYKMCYDSLESWANDQLTPGERELAPGGPVVGALAGDTALPGVSYYTYGGMSPTFVRYYVWFFTPGSAVPQYRCDPFPTNCEQYFDWVANASELPGISPMLDALPDHFVSRGNAWVWRWIGRRRSYTSAVCNSRDGPAQPRRGSLGPPGAGTGLADSIPSIHPASATATEAESKVMPPVSHQCFSTARHLNSGRDFHHVIRAWLGIRSVGVKQLNCFKTMLLTRTSYETESWVLFTRSIRLPGTFSKETPGSSIQAFRENFLSTIKELPLMGI